MKTTNRIGILAALAAGMITVGTASAQVESPHYSKATRYASVQTSVAAQASHGTSTDWAAIGTKHRSISALPVAKSQSATSERLAGTNPCSKQATMGAACKSHCS